MLVSRGLMSPSDATTAPEAHLERDNRQAPVKLFLAEVDQLDKESFIQKLGAIKLVAATR